MCITKKKCKEELRDIIKNAKTSSWKFMCDSVDVISGNSYKIFIKFLIGFPPAVVLSVTFNEKVVNCLFLIHEEVYMGCVKLKNK